MTLIEKLRSAEFVIAGYAHMSRRSIQTKEGEFLDDLLHDAADALVQYQAAVRLALDSKYFSSDPGFLAQPKVGVGQQGIE